VIKSFVESTSVFELNVTPVLQVIVFDTVELVPVKATLINLDVVLTVVAVVLTEVSDPIGLNTSDIF